MIATAEQLGQAVLEEVLVNAQPFRVLCPSCPGSQHVISWDANAAEQIGTFIRDWIEKNRIEPRARD